MEQKELSPHVESLLQNQVFSFSRLKLFEGCPYRWFLKYVEKIEESEALPLMLGKAVHKAIEEKMLGKSDKEALLEGWKEVTYYPLDLIEYESLYRRANVVKGDALRPNVEVEKHFTLPLDGEGSPRIQGFIDVIRQIFGSYSFTDWKTNRMMYDPMENMQLALYAWALSKIYGVSEISGTLFFLRFFKDNAKTMTFKKEEMEEARLWALEVSNHINSAMNDYYVANADFDGCFPAKANPGCANCPYADICMLNYPKISEGVFASERFID
jgi:hypothetical protein